MADELVLRLVRDELVADARRPDLADATGRPRYGPRFFDAGQRIRASDIHPRLLDRLVRLGRLVQVKE